MLRELIKRNLSKMGYELKSKEADGWHPESLRKRGFKPRTLVDVGVADGTPGLHEAFPDSYHVLVEPLKEFEGDLKNILKNYEGTYFLTAIGAREETQTINFEPNVKTKSSFQTRTSLTATGDAVEKRDIPVTTLDALLEKHKFAPPFGLKVDTEGFELQVIKGATDFLKQTEFVIAEVSVTKRFEQSYSFAEFIELMDRNDFRLYDILKLRRAPHSEVRFMDALFTRCDARPRRAQVAFNSSAPANRESA